MRHISARWRQVLFLLGCALVGYAINRKVRKVEEPAPPPPKPRWQWSAHHCTGDNGKIRFWAMVVDHRDGVDVNVTSAEWDPRTLSFDELPAELPDETRKAMERFFAELQRPFANA